MCFTAAFGIPFTRVVSLLKSPILIARKLLKTLPSYFFIIAKTTDTL